MNNKCVVSKMDVEGVSLSLISLELIFYLDLLLFGLC